MSAELPVGAPIDSDDAQAFSNMQAFKALEFKRTRKKKRKVIRIVLIIVAVLLAACGGVVWYITAQMNAAMEGLSVETAIVERGDFARDISGSGSLVPNTQVTITPEVDGIVGTVNVSEGSQVTVGTVLFTIENDELDSAIAQASQGVQEASNALKQAKLSLNNAYDAYDAAQAAEKNAIAAEETRKKKLADAQAAGEDQTLYLTPIETDLFDEAARTNAIESAELGVNNACLALESAQSAYDKAVAMGEKRTVTSPIVGSVTTLGIESGASLATLASSGRVACQVADLSKMKVTIQVNEADIVDIALDQIATITFAAISGLELEGKVTRIATMSTGSSTGALLDYSDGVVTYAVELLIDAPDSRLKPGMTAKAKISIERLSNVLMVPLMAVQDDGDGKTYLIVQTDESTGASENRMVKVIASNATSSVVEGDIQEGDIVLMGSGLLDELAAKVGTSSSGVVADKEK